MAGSSATRSAMASVSDASAHLPLLQDPGPLFPGKNGGRSLAEMAYSDLDAALQLLAERAQYITGANGAAIALRRGQHNDMLCRASVGSNAPELGALLSMEYGLSGESVRTHEALRCDDTERDPRVNREGCRQLGIASVVVMPIVSEQQVLGVFELFSGKARAFEERDLSALQRLSEMVQTAVQHAMTTPAAPALQEMAGVESQPSSVEHEMVEHEVVVETVTVESPAIALLPDLPPSPSVSAKLSPDLEQPESKTPELKEEAPEATKPDPAPKKPLFWSVAMQPQATTPRPDSTAQSVAVPPGLRNLQKCQACGFPVSQGRTFCVECEEKQWRGQRPSAQTQTKATAAAPQPVTSAPVESQAAKVQTSPEHVPDPPADFSPSDDRALFSSSSAPESFFAANKYIFGALLVVAIVIGTILWLR